jgi:hypothetical protein
MAIVSLVAGITSFVLVPILAAIVAIITGHMARKQIRQTGEAGATLATIGLVLGYVHLALVAIGIIIVVVLVVVFGTIIATAPSSG